MAFAQTAIQPIPELSAPPRRVADSSPMQSIGSVCHFARNRTIFSDGDAALYAYRVLSGAVRLVKLMADGRRHIAGFQLSGDLFGLEWSSEYTLTAEAVSDVVLVRYARNTLDRLGDERVDVRRQLTDRLKADLREAHAHLISLGCQSAKERVASFLLHLARREEQDATIEVPMGRQDIADYLGLTIETVCRTLTELKDVQVIAIPSRHQIAIRDFDRLESIADCGSDA